jgi:hypothetical protein
LIVRRSLPVLQARLLQIGFEKLVGDDQRLDGLASITQARGVKPPLSAEPLSFPHPLSGNQFSVRADGQALTLLRVSRSVVVRAGVMMTVVVMALLVVIAIVERLRGGNDQDHQYRECSC